MIARLWSRFESTSNDVDGALCARAAADSNAAAAMHTYAIEEVKRPGELINRVYPRKEIHGQQADPSTLTDIARN